MNLFTADLHLMHNNILSHTQRGRDTTEKEHDRWVIEQCNKHARPGDTLYVLGDFCFGKSRHVREFLQDFDARVVILPGNHDVHWVGGWQPFLTPYLELKIMVPGEEHNKRICMMHYPLQSWNQQHRGSWHLHGHSHGNMIQQGYRLDVGIDSAYQLLGEHRPFTQDEIIAYMATQEKYIAEPHRRALASRTDEVA